MKKVFTHENRMILYNLRNILEAEGIETLVVNEFAAGGVGDLAAFDTWPELWIEDESKLAQARTIVQEILSDELNDARFCQKCGEQNEAAFRICWNCGNALE